MDGVAVGRWKLDGEVLDGSGHGRHGTVEGEVAWAAGQSTYPDPHDLALQLDGARGNGVRAAHVVNTAQSFSVAAWVRADKSDIGQFAVSQDDSFRLGTTAAGAWAFTMYDAAAPATRSSPGYPACALPPCGTTATGGAIKTGAWTHLAAVYDAGAERMSLYVNGALVGSADHQTTDSQGLLRLGYMQKNRFPGGYLAGALDDVTLYSRTLFSEEIKVMSGRDLSLVHQWRFDEPGGGEAGDAVGARHGTLAGGAGFTGGRVGNAITLDGVNDSASTDGVDVRTDDSFTVTAWVHLSEEASKNCDLSEPPYSCYATAVSVDGNRSSKFRLGFVKDDDENPDGAWTFELPEEDKDNAPVTNAAVSARASDFDSWVHLTAIYDRPARSLVLYVNGERQGEGKLLNPWKPTGGVQIGRGRANGADSEFWPGHVDDVRLYTGAHDKTRVKSLFASYPPAQGAATLPTDAVGQWKLDEGTGTTAADSRGTHPVTLSGGAAWIGGRSGNGLWLDGTSGYAQTAGPVLDMGPASSGFSVAAWAYVAPSAPAQLERGTIVAQDGTRTSAFALTYDRAAGTWAAELAGTDSDDPRTVLRSVEPVQLGRWTHLALVYDTPLRQARLYVNGVLSAVQVGVSVFDAGGPLTMGRALRSGVPADFFWRGVDDVRAFSRPLSDGEVRRVHDDVPALAYARYTFDDGTANDSSWRKAHATPSGGTSFVPGKVGQALRLDGTSGSAATSTQGVAMVDSFTISAWAKLDSTAETATVVGQDGSRMSAFVLQYRAGLNRWVFGGHARDADGAEPVYARAATAPEIGRWTHLTGVYDYAARRLRLYVDGKLAGVKDGVALWTAASAFSIGRGRVNGESDDYFPGAIDEVCLDLGQVPDAVIAQRAAA
ncbi:LamG-like jellyroll fold domain-containing protein [Nonomuraea thailandensis]